MEEPQLRERMLGAIAWIGVTDLPPLKIILDLARSVC
jgi:hypothetical protein